MTEKESKSEDFPLTFAEALFAAQAEGATIQREGGPLLYKIDDGVLVACSEGEWFPTALDIESLMEEKWRIVEEPPKEKLITWYRPKLIRYSKGSWSVGQQWVKDKRDALYRNYEVYNDEWEGKELPE